MTYSKRLKHLLSFLTISLLIGSIATTAAAQEKTVCIERAAAESCKNKTEQFDALLSESEKVRRQRDEAVGTANELRFLYFDVLADAQDWKVKADVAQRAADNAPSRLTWFVIGAGTGAVVVVVVAVLAGS